MQVAPGVQRAGDGSLTIRLQRSAPDDPQARANWLPTPLGPLRPILRMYEPRPAVVRRGCELPPITRI
jgi:hypothetical protein